jgi:hypothetical protein
MRENRQFLARAVRWATGQGISQFIDPGCGMAAAPNTYLCVRPAAARAPGVVDARLWHPDGELAAPLPPRPGQSLVGVPRVGRVPSGAPDGSGP